MNHHGKPLKHRSRKYPRMNIERSESKGERGGEGGASRSIFVNERRSLTTGTWKKGVEARIISREGGWGVDK